MALSIHASAAVTRTLRDIAQALGLTTVAEGDDQLHHTAHQLEYRRNGHTVQQLPCPAPAEAVARMLAAMQTAGAMPLDNGWQLDPTARQLVHEGTHHTLTEKETLLLKALLAALPRACTRETLLRDVWAMQTDVETHTLETHIYRLRHKLAELSPRPCDIITIDGAYQLQLGSSA